MLLDTAALVDLLAGEPAIEPVCQQLDARGGAITTAASAAGLWRAAHRVGLDATKRRRVEALLADVPVVATTRPIAMAAAERSAGWDGHEAAVVAATARQRRLAVLTGRPAAYRGCDDLDVRTYRRD